MTNNHINYIELYAHDLAKIKKFYSQVFGWQFTDYGDGYTAFAESGIDGGFELTDKPIVHGALVILYHTDLNTCLENIKKANGIISKAIFSFPGGKRFHFIDPTGNELAVWSDK